MQTMIRKNITISQEMYDKINNFAKKQGKTFSEFIRETAIKGIEELENMELLDYLTENIDYCSQEEQNELDKLNIDFSKTNGKELTLNELL